MSACGAYFRSTGSEAATIDSLQERVNDCFQRSMNGKALAYDSKEMNAILMYMQWLSRGIPVALRSKGVAWERSTLPCSPIAPGQADLR